MDPAADPVSAFGPFRVDRPGGQILRDGQAVPIGRRAFDTLLALLDAAGETLSKDTLLATVWPGLIVEENNLQVQISALRKVLGDGWIITVPGRGYRIAPGSLSPPAPTDSPPPLPDRPSLVVLPFANHSGHPEQEYFVDGLVEDITTALSRIGGLFVIARNSAFTYKGRAVDVREVGRDLGVRYVLEGSVRKAGNRVRVTGQLVDAVTGVHLWADRFDGPLDDVLDLQDRVTASVAGILEPRLQRAEIERAQRKATQDLGAYDCFLRGIAILHEANAERMPCARALFAQAASLDPGYGAAFGMAAWTFTFDKTAGNLAASGPEVAEAIRLARLAAAISRDDATALWSGGGALAYVGGQPEAAALLIERACDLNPNSAQAWNLALPIHGVDGRFAV